MAGSKLIAQDFRVQAKGPDGKPKVDSDGNPVMVPLRRYFQPRPSTATVLRGRCFLFTNLGPNSKDARDTYSVEPAWPISSSSGRSIPA